MDSSNLAQVKPSIRDTIFPLPNNYEKRRHLHKNFFRQSNIYIFSVNIQSIKVVGNKVFVNASVFDKKITIVHSYKMAKFFRTNTKKICGSLKYENQTEDAFNHSYDVSVGDKYDDTHAESNSIEDEIMLTDPLLDEDEYKWNRGWAHLSGKLFCFFPEIFDLRTGLIARYSKLKPAAVKKLITFIEQNAPISIRSYLLEIHSPSNIECLNYCVKKLLVIELSCFLKYMNRKLHTDRMIKDPYVQLPIKLTKSQEIALDEIYKELASGYRMSRVLYGDVGSGKTIVAILTALKCIANGKNVLYLVPTQLLAKQIIKNFHKFTPHIDTHLFIKDFKTMPKKNEPFIIVGTHALLWQKFENIGLVIIDEQHKFGVEQRNILTQNNNLLMMTATIIPRTFQMIRLGNLSFSCLEPRQNTPSIETLIVDNSKKKELFKEIINLAKDEKVIWVTSSIEITEKNYHSCGEEDINIFLLHGKIKDKNLILTSFDQSNNGILFATTVIEVGIDIDLNYIVIEDADQFGLAQLHQIRGRVGRRNQKGTCILIGNNTSKLQEIKNAQSGFEVSELDIKSRGFGSLKNNTQSGFENFIFARELKERKWYTMPINDQIIKEAYEHEIQDEIFEIFMQEIPDEKLKI